MNKKKKADEEGGNEEPPSKKLNIHYPDFYLQRFQCNVPDKFIYQIANNDSPNKHLTSNSIFPGCSLQLSFRPGVELGLADLDDLLLSPQKEFVDKRLLIDNILADNLQKKMFGIIGRYMDFCCAAKNNAALETYCYHVLNHLLRSRNLIISNQKRLEGTKMTITDELIEECRDQGLTRPTVLILAPFKKSAYQIVKTMTRILVNDDKSHILNLVKFEEEYGSTETNMHEKWRAPQEFKDVFSGNIDDSFRIGLSLGKKAIKLYTAFDNSDIILCSPLGLRMIIGDEEEEKDKRETDFLSSIEIVVLEKTNVMYMQNWEHLLTVLSTLNQMPQEVKTDISRVRHWVLKGYGRNYRQLIAFSDINFAELHSLFAANSNITGQAKLIQNPQILLQNVDIPILQELHRFECEEPSQQSDFRFAYFVRNVLPKLKPGAVVFIPSYFDYIRIRNYLKKDEESFSQIHEYASDGKIRKSRKAFARGEKKLLLVTERCQFYRHFIVSGVKSLVFYQMPFNPRFYEEMINMGETGGTLHTTLIFCKYDVLRLQNVFGLAQAKQLILSKKKFHALLSE